MSRLHIRNTAFFSPAARHVSYEKILCLSCVQGCTAGTARYVSATMLGILTFHCGESIMQNQYNWGSNWMIFGFALWVHFLSDRWDCVFAAADLVFSALGAFHRAPDPVVTGGRCFFCVVYRVGFGCIWCQFAVDILEGIFYRSEWDRIGDVRNILWFSLCHEPDISMLEVHITLGFLQIYHGYITDISRYSISKE